MIVESEVSVYGLPQTIILRGYINQGASFSQQRVPPSRLRFPRKPAGGEKQASADAQANIPEDPPIAPEEVVWRQQVLEWFQKHAFGQVIDCNFKLRHKVK